MPEISVVIPLYNKADYIEETITSVLKQNYQDFEIIVVDDGSTDNGLEVVKRFQSDKIKIFEQENQGVSVARNFGIEKASGNFIALLDADDFWHPFYLEEQHRLIKKYPNQSVFATAQEIINKNRAIPNHYSIDFKNNQEDVVVNYFEASLLSSVLHSSSTLIRKEVFQKIGFYDPKIKSGQDTDLYIQIGLEYDVVFSPKICSSYKQVENSLFRSSTSLKDKIDLTKYEHFEETNPALKKFLDMNRFSLAVFAKIHNDKNGFREIYKKINLNNLNKKQQLILNLPSALIRNLVQLKNLLSGFGLNIMIFK